MVASRFALWLVLLLLACLPAAAGDRRLTPDDARRSVERGEARPLADIIARVRGRLGGEVVNVELERSETRLVYEFKIVNAQGQRREVYVDARSGEILTGEEED